MAYTYNQAADDIAIVGYAFKLPQDVNDDNSFWNTIQSKRNLATSWPESRMTADSFLNTNNERPHPRAGHFINEDVKGFDAPFFSVTAKEAASMDPLQRWTLEVSYRAFEKAGITAEKLRASQTAVYSASMIEDYSRMVSMDPDTSERSAATGSSVSCVIPNRVSWYFDLRGPSAHVNTACSSSLLAIDLACKTLKSGDASCALVTGANLLLSPAYFHLLSHQNFLSPDGVCYSFDHRANGYGRGEGILAVVLKPVALAVKDGDMIRAVIRSTGSNQDGHTPVLTQPSLQSQEDLIRHVYKQANLSPDATRYVEAHGTGTQAGDPTETKAIGRVFRKSRSQKQPLYIGSVKSNIGHLEGASGLAGLLKIVLALERGVIPPNALFEKINPAIDTDLLNIEIPTKSLFWPCSGLRRASINSFGFGGSNTHVVIDDALHYLQGRGLPGNHCTLSVPDSVIGREISTLQNGHHKDYLDTAFQIGIEGPADRMPRLLVWTAADEQAVNRTTQAYEPFYYNSIANSSEMLDRLSYTLAARRTKMLWRTFAIVKHGNPDDDEDTKLSMVKPIRSSTDTGLAFVFTGQGAQYTGMGVGLLAYPVFENTLQLIDGIYKSLGCSWSIFDELQSSENIDKPEYSQPLSTAVQLGLVELLASFGVVPKAVVGHSSGEIAAAYVIGALTLISACKVSYYRGQLAGKLRAASTSSPGAMMSINLTEDEVADYLSTVPAENLSSVGIACINGPFNCTLSGPEDAINAIKARAELDDIFVQKLKTGVAYHSPAMQIIADDYISLMGTLESAASQDIKAASRIPMVSSVSGKVIRPAVLATAQYWVQNMISPVRFADAIQMLTQETSKLKLGIGSITDLVEVGSHPALRRVVQDTVQQATNKKKNIRYGSPLHRTQEAIPTLLDLIGRLFCSGYTISITAANQQDDKLAPFLVDCPEYPFDRSQKYWSESRIARDYRLRGQVKGDVLGARASDWNPLEPRWRNFLSTETVPWIGHHKVSDTVIYPGAGMLIMAIEAVQQIVPEDRTVAGFLVKEADLINPILVQEAWEDRTETQVSLKPTGSVSHEDLSTALSFEVDIFSYLRERWTKCLHATIQIDFDDASDIHQTEHRKQSHNKIHQQFGKAVESCRFPIEPSTFYHNAAKHGLQYGDLFKLLREIRHDGNATTVARVNVTEDIYRTNSLVHPAVLDQAFHVLRASAGQQTAANIPVRIVNAWFASSSQWQHPQTESLRWVATSASTASLEDAEVFGEEGRLAAFADDGTVLCSVERAVSATVASQEAKSTEKRKLLFNVDWKPQLSLTGPEQLTQLCHHNSVKKNETAVREFYPKLIYCLELVCARTLSQLDRSKIHETQTRHVQWMDYHTRKMSRKARKIAVTTSDSELAELIHELDSLHPEWRSFTICCEQLPAILTGNTDPLAVVFESDQTEIFYRHLFQSVVADGQFSTILELLCHENPALRILEVGGGTGGMTSHVIKFLEEREKRTGGASFSEYTFTDISPMFFERSRERWSHLKAQGRLNLKVLDLDKPIDSQGYEPGSYDLVVAASVLHATPYLEATLRNVRTALKPGGKLILLECVAPDHVTTNFMPGLVPGWWVAREDWRSNSPAIQEDVWDTILRGNGFSGNDVIIRDYEDEYCHLMSIIVSTAVEEDSNSTTVSDGRLIFVVDEQKSPEHLHLANLLSKQLDPENQLEKSILGFTLEDFSKGLANLTKEDTVICIAEACNKPLLSNLSEVTFKCLQYLVKYAPRLLWATKTSFEDSQYPEYSITAGFLRSIRNEQADIHAVNIYIEDEMDIFTSTEWIAKAFKASFGPNASNEVEYIVRDGFILTGRAIEDTSSNDALQALLSRQLEYKPWGEGPALKLSVGKPGDLQSLRYVRDLTHETELGDHEIEIEAKAWGLSYKDLQTGTGRREDIHHAASLGGDCAGIVTRVGKECKSSIQPGDRVCMVTPGCMAQCPRGDDKAVYKIPEAFSYAEATSALLPGITASYALMDVARLEEGDKVLIHAAASAVGQVAIRIAQNQGAEIIATCANGEEKDFLLQSMKIPRSHLIDNTTIAFKEAVLQVTRGSGVDVVFNWLSGQDNIEASCECLSSGGYFLDIVRGGIDASMVLPVRVLERNIHYSFIDPLALKPKAISRHLKATIELMAEGSIHPPQPLSQFGASTVSAAFEELQSGNILSRVIITLSPEESVPQYVQDIRPWKFDSNASYLIAGGTGGLGRAIVRWMTERGAKYFILPSRSGGGSKASELFGELKDRGIQIIAPKCDVSSRENLSSMLDECSRTMPPIKGCINAAMVLQDAVFQDSMTFAQWELTMKSKVKTSWALHHLLPRDLDFFIMFSSMAGVVGQMGGANYAGGCTFQDALVRYRLAHGQTALSLDIGWMSNIGIIAETEAYQRQRQSLEDMKPIDEAELLAALTMYCDPSTPLPPLISQSHGQVLFGMKMPRDLLLQGQEPHELMNRPLFAAFSFVSDSGAITAGAAVNPDAAATIAVRFKQASDAEERFHIVMDALSAKLARAMSISADDVQVNKPLSGYGVDSLMAVDLRNWIRREFSATVAVFEIIGGVPIMDIADLIVQRSTIGKSAS